MLSKTIPLDIRPLSGLKSTFFILDSLKKKVRLFALYSPSGQTHFDKSTSSILAYLNRPVRFRQYFILKFSLPTTLVAFLAVPKSIQFIPLDKSLGTITSSSIYIVVTAFLTAVVGSVVLEPLFTQVPALYPALC